MKVKMERGRLNDSGRWIDKELQGGTGRELPRQGDSPGETF